MTKRTESEAGAEGTWTSETLPLKLRRELMNRELRQVLADRNVASAADMRVKTDETRPDRRQRDKKRP